MERLRDLPPEIRPPAPRLPSFKNLAEWVRERPQRRKRFLWRLAISLAAIALILASAPRGWRFAKGWYARQLATQSLALIDQKQWTFAAVKIRRAFDIRPTETEVWRANARLLTRIRQSDSAIEWWEKVGEARPLSLEDRRDFAAAALSANELGVATEQIARIRSMEQDVAPADRLLVGQLSSLRGNSAAAAEEANKVLASADATSQERLAASLLVLVASKPDSAEYSAAAARIVSFARDSTDSASLDALTLLARQFAAQPPGDTSDRPLAIPAPDIPTGSIPLTEIAQRLEQHSKSRPFHKMLAMEMRSRSEPGHDDELMANAIKAYGESDDETLAALGAWLYTRGRFDLILEVLPLDRAMLSRNLLIERIDALAASGRMTEAKEMLSTEYAVLNQAYQHMYLAVIRTKLGDATAAEHEWLRALETTDRVQSMLALGEYAAKYSRPEIAEAAYGLATLKQPGLRSAYSARLRLLEVNGPTEKAHQVAKQIIDLWPVDTATRIHELYLRLLLDPSPENAKAAEQEAEVLLAQTPWEGLARSTLALARFRQGKADAALEVFRQARSDLPATEVSWPVYAAVLEANGWKADAREQAQKIAAIKLLPEERALIAPILKRNL